MRYIYGFREGRAKYNFELHLKRDFELYLNLFS